MLQMAKARLPVSSLIGEDIRADPDAYGQIPILDLPPSPADFFSDFVMRSRPLVMRNLADEMGFPPMAHFIDFSYLRHRCGHRRVCVKSLALDDSEGRPVFVSDPELRIPLQAFLAAVESAERDRTRCPFYLGKVPLRAELPELDEDIHRAPSNPAQPYTECFGPLTPHGIYTYFGCDRNVTPTHFDQFENLLLCVCGTKRLWLYPPSDAPYLYPPPGKEPSRSAAPPFKLYHDLSPDLQASYPALVHARPLEVILRAGDLLYLPSCWWHCVEGSHERNMILNWWFQPHPSKAQQA